MASCEKGGGWAGQEESPGFASISVIVLFFFSKNMLSLHYVRRRRDRSSWPRWPKSSTNTSPSSNTVSGWVRQRMSTTILNGKQHQIENKQQQLSAIQPQLTISSTISNYGFRPWLKLMISKKVESSLADNHHTTKIKRCPNITFYNLIFFIFRTVFSKGLQI